MKISYIILCSFILYFFNSCSNNQSLKNDSQITVLSENEGEIFSPDKGGRTTMIKVSPRTGSKNLSLVIQKMPDKTKIPVHKHDYTEEVFL